MSSKSRCNYCWCRFRWHTPAVYLLGQDYVLVIEALASPGQASTNTRSWDRATHSDHSKIYHAQIIGLLDMEGSSCDDIDSRGGYSFVAYDDAIETH